MIVKRYTNTDTFTIDAQFITPALIHGPDTRKVELRSAPIKAALRYWWRVLYGSTFAKDKDSEGLFKRESQLFGSTEQASPLRTFVDLSANHLDRQSFIRYFQNGKMIDAINARNRPINFNILKYLSYGAWDAGGNTECIPEGFRFNFQLKTSKEATDEVLAALYALSYFGGLGAKNKNGFGSFQLLSCNKNGNDKIMFDDRLIRNIPDWRNTPPTRFPALNNRAQLFRTKIKYNNPVDVLNTLGEFYYTARVSLEDPHDYKKRREISRPLIVKQHNGDADRRAKPFHLKVIKEDNSYIGQILVLPTCYPQAGNYKFYLQAVHDMTEYFRQSMNDVTANILPMQGNNNVAR